MTIIGAGVIGLTTAVVLRDAGHDVRIVAERLAQETTSVVAGAMWGGTFAGPLEQTTGWSERSLQEFTALADDPARTGVHMMRGKLAAAVSDGPPPPFLFPGVEIAPRPAGDVPPGYKAAYAITLPVADMPRYLGYLQSRLAGVPVERARVERLADVEGDAVVNCTGVGARELAADPGVTAVRGQHVYVANPGLTEFFMEEPEDEWASFFPFPTHVVLGGLAQRDDWSLEPDPATAQAIVERCAAIEPALADAEVLGHRVGLRPARADVRLERDPGDPRVLHNYGHGGSGVGLSWGCAHAVAALLQA